jgi:predicted alpha/beta-hydrolase family hydrolase
VDVFALPVEPELRFEGPSDAARTVALADGAGAGTDLPFASLFTKALPRGACPVVRCRYPYTASSRVTGKQNPPDRTLLGAKGS